ncbi:MAG: hypothetical protein JSS65_14985 [Armatimonadetes bacterium]|nr:hypothetical protein [Armatimonadota bacterium]
MTTIGDVLMVFGGLLALAGTTWAAIVLAALLFPGRTASAAQELEDRAGRVWWVGLVATFVALSVAFVLVSLPLPLVKFLGFCLLGGHISLAVVGAAGLTRLLGKQIKGAGGPAENFGAFLRGAGLLVGACSIPLFGWLFLSPVVLVMGTGAGLRSFFPAKAPERFGAEA